LAEQGPVAESPLTSPTVLDPASPESLLSLAADIASSGWPFAHAGTEPSSRA